MAIMYHLGNSNALWSSLIKWNIIWFYLILYNFPDIISVILKFWNNCVTFVCWLKIRTKRGADVGVASRRLLFAATAHHANGLLDYWRRSISLTVWRIDIWAFCTKRYQHEMRYLFLGCF